MNPELIEKYSGVAIDWLIKVVPSILLAIAILVIGWILAGFIGGILEKAMKKAKVDKSLTPFVKSLTINMLKVLVVISAAGVMGVQTTSFIAVLGAAGFAVGMALQGSLGNFAGGVLILLFKPIKVGEYIEAQGHGGTVEEIQMFCTLLTSIDNKVIILPNGPLAGGSIVNYSRNETRRVDLTFGIGYGDDIDKAKEVIKATLQAHDKILKSPEATIFVSEQADSSVNFAVRPWVKTSDYWTVYFDLQENMKKAFDKNGISIPFPQRDIHIIKEG